MAATDTESVYKNAASVRAAAWNAAHPERRRVIASAHYSRNHGEVIARSAARREAQPEKDRQYKRARWFLLAHGLTLAALADLLSAQGGRCYLCRQELVLSQVVIDHDHSCCPPNRSCPGCRRGLAHGKCNRAVGFFRDSPAVLRQFADNLETAQLLLGLERML